MMNIPSADSSWIFADKTSRTLARRACNGCSRPAAATQSGVGLIEVLVAVLVLSIGFLGVAALQAMSLSTNNGAMAQSMATVNSYSILDAMRADIASARGGSYNATVTASTCPATATTASLSNTQLIQWCNQLKSTLGSAATGRIACTVTGDCTITISFDDSRAGAQMQVNGSTTQQVVTRAML